MKKLVLIMTVLCAMAVGHAYADIQINWNTVANSLYKADGTTLLPANSLFLAYWSPDNSNAGFDNANPTVPTGGDALLGVYNINTPPAAGRITRGAITYPNPAYDNGFVYVAVFDMLFSTYTGPADLLGKQYGLAASGGPALPVPPGTALPYGTTYIGTTAPLVTSSTVVPEPTVAFLGLIGVGTIVFRRLRRKDG